MPLDPRDYKLDLTSAPQSPSATNSSGRPFLSVQFACCSVYQRIYRDPNGQQYHGRCPRCGKSVTFAVGEGGTNNRFFVVR